MTLYFDEDIRPDDQTAAVMEAAAVAALEGEGIDPSFASISVSFVDKKEIKSLNAQYRGVDKETDVLSFPAFEPGAIPAEAELEEDEELALGDVVICEEVCRKQAERRDVRSSACARNPRRRGGNTFLQGSSGRRVRGRCSWGYLLF